MNAARKQENAVNPMTKTLSRVLAVLVALGGVSVIAGDVAKKAPSDPGREAVRPLVADHFGVVISVEGIFVQKRNTDHDRNMVREPYLVP